MQLALTITRYDVVPGCELMFEAGIELARRLFIDTPAYHDLSLEQSLSCPGRYWLLVQWDQGGDPATRFGGASLYSGLADLVSDCLAGPPQIERCHRSISGTAADPPPLGAARNEGMDIYRLVSRPPRPFDTQRRPAVLSEHGFSGHLDRSTKEPDSGWGAIGK